MMGLMTGFAAHAGMTRIGSNGGRCLDISGASRSNSVQLQQYDCNVTIAQQFDVRALGGGFYEIRTLGGGDLCVDVSGAMPYDGTRIQQYACNASPAQQFTLVARGGQYEIHPRVNPAACVDIDGASTANSAKVSEYTCHGGANQLFDLTPPMSPGIVSLDLTKPTSVNGMTPGGSGASFHYGYVNPGAQLVLPFTVPGPGTYVVSVGYASPYGNTGVDVSVGAGAPTFVKFDATGDWSKFTTSADTLLTVSTGSGSLRIVANQTGFDLNAVTLKPAASTGTTTTTSPSNPTAARSAFVPANYVPVFADEFEGTGLDVAKWFTRFVYSGGTLDYVNDEVQRYRESDNHRVSNGTLKLVAKPQADGSFTSGMIRSKTTMKYGYFETRVKMPSGLGTWTAFWLNPEDQKWPPEIDIFEYLNNGRDDKVNMFNTRGQDHGPQGYKQIAADAGFDQTWKTFGAPYSFADDFHVFGALWDTDDTVTVTLDGKVISKYAYKWVHDDSADAGPAHILLNLAMGGSWAGRYGIDRTREHVYEIDYVRAYQRADAVKTGVSTTGKDLCPASGC